MSASQQVENRHRLYFSNGQIADWHQGTIPPNLSNAIARLRDFSLKALSADEVDRKPEARTQSQVSVDICQVGKIAWDRSKSIRRYLQDPELRARLSARLKTKGEDRKALKRVLHYAGPRHPAKAGERLKTRSALCLAFAHGANAAQLKALRKFLDQAPASSGLHDVALIKLNLPKVPIDDLQGYLSSISSQPSGKLLTALSNATPGGFDALFGFLRARHPAAGDQLSMENLKQINDPFLREDIRLFSAVASYCGNDNEEINWALRNGTPLQDKQASFVETACAALKRLPDHAGIVARGVDLTPDKLNQCLEKYQPGQTITEPTFLSTSATSTEHFYGNALFVINSRHGKNVSELSGNFQTDGKEVLFPPGTQFKVVERQQVGEQTVIFMDEVA